MNEAAKPPRDFTYIRPSKGRLSEYEAVTCFTQPDPDVMDAPGWFLRSSEGRPAWLRDSTHLKHPCWFDFRDPAGMWQRSYVRMQAEQERALEMLVGQARSAGAFKDFHPIWISLMLGGHYRVWAYFEYGMFRAFAQAQREALSDTLGNVFSFEAVDRMRHAQAVVIYLMELEDNIPGFKDGGGKQEWLSSPIYQPARRMTEQVMTLTDWGELAVAVNLVIDPIFGEVGTSQLLRRFGPVQGDIVTPSIVMSAEQDRRRNQGWTAELVRMVTSETVEEREHNRQLIQDWINHWTLVALFATRALAPVYEMPLIRGGSFAEAFLKAQRAQAELVQSLGFQPAAEIVP